MRLRRSLFVLALMMIAALSAGCADQRTASGSNTSLDTGIVGSWLEESAAPDLLIHFFPNQTAYVKYLLAVQNQESTVTRQGTWEALPPAGVNLSYTAPFTSENRTITLQVDGNRARVVHVYNGTAELPESQQGRINTSFVRIRDAGA